MIIPKLETTKKDWLIIYWCTSAVKYHAVIRKDNVHLCVLTWRDIHYVFSDR